MAYTYDAVAPDLRESIARGTAEIQTLNKHENFKRWMIIGQACIDMQTAAIQLSGANMPKGKGYNEAYKLISEHASDLAKLDKTVRSHAVWMAHPERRQAIIDWHAILPDNIRHQCNHPMVVKRRYEKDKVPAIPRDSDEKKPPTGLRAVVAQLQEELDEALRKVQHLERNRENLTEGRDWNWSDREDDIARAWYTMYPTKIVKIASKVMQLHKPESIKPRKRVKKEEMLALPPPADNK